MPPSSGEQRAESGEPERTGLAAAPALDPRPSAFDPSWPWLGGLVLLISLHFWFPPLDRGTPHDTWSAEAEGKKAFFLLADERRGASRNTELLTRGLDGFDPHTVLLLLGPARGPDPAEWSMLLDWVSGGGSLVVAARTDDPELEIPGLEIRVQPLPDDEVVDTAEAWTAFGDFTDLVWRTGGEIVAPRAQPIVATDTAIQAVRQSHGSGQIVVVASDFIFSNQSLDYGDNSVLAYRLLEAARRRGEAVFDESLNITGTPKVVGLLLGPLLRPLTVQLLVGLLLIAWWRSRRFGPALARSTSARHNIVDHTDAVGLLTWRTRDGAVALHSYLRQLLVELRLASSASRAQEERILQPIARRLRRDVDSVRKILRRADELSRVELLPRRVAAQHIRRLAVIRRAAEDARAPRHRSREPAAG